MLGRVNFEDSKIGFDILADQIGLQLGAVVEIDFNLVGIRNDVIIGDDEALLGIDDEARSKRLHLARLVALLAILVVEEILEVLLERRAFRHFRHGHGAIALAAIVFHRLRGGDIYHRIQQPFCEIGNGTRTLNAFHGSVLRKGRRRCDR